MSFLIIETIAWYRYTVTACAFPCLFFFCFLECGRGTSRGHEYDGWELYKKEGEKEGGDSGGEKFRSVGQKEIPFRFREFLVSDLHRFFSLVGCCCLPAVATHFPLEMTSTLKVEHEYVFVQDERRCACVHLCMTGVVLIFQLPCFSP